MGSRPHDLARRDVTFVNCTAETFTPTHSGAIATWIWEVCRVAQLEGLEPLVITRSSEHEAYSWRRTVHVDYPCLPRNRLEDIVFQAGKRITGWGHVRERAYNARLAAAIATTVPDTRTPLVLQNGPELAVFLRRRFPGRPIVHHFQNMNGCSRRFRRTFGRSVNVASAVSDACAAWNAEYFGTPVTTLYSGVDADRFRPAASPPAGKPVIGFVGLTDRHKGIDLLLQAALRLSQRTTAFEVQILGGNRYGGQVDDPYQRLLDRLVGDLEGRGVRVRRPGFVPRAELPDQLRRSHIHVVPSRWDEPFGLVTLEGMACGLATVAAAVGGIPEIVGSAGILFERESVDGLADALERLVGDAFLRQDLGLRARARALDFTWRRTWSRLQELLPI